MDETIGALSTRELGGFLVTNRAAIDAAEARWLAALAEFDHRGGFAVDGHRDTVGWLMERCGLALSTAKERLRVALELEHRPVLAQALAQGRVSFTKIKTLTRMTGVDDSADATFVAVAQAGTHADVQQLYRHWKLLHDQDKPPAPNRWDRWGIETVHRSGAMAVMELRVPVEDEQRLMRILDAAAEVLCPVDKAPMGALSTTPAAPTQADGLQPTWIQRRAQGLVHLAEAGLAWLQANHGVDPDRVVVNVICDYDQLVEQTPGTAELEGGYPITGEAARRLACDAGLVRIITRGASEILDVGRKTREWNTAQRRAINYRWAGRCAFPGCGYRMTQLHHTNPWHPGGETNLDYGVPLCSFHHHLVHDAKWAVAYDPTQRAAIFTSPTGQTVTAPTPGALTWTA